jgi:hypothetical protein
MRKYELALSVVCMVAALLGVSACSSPSTDETITTAVKNRAGGDPSRRAWALYKDDTPIAAFWNAVDMTAVTDAENDPWLRGNRAGCDFLMTKLNDLNPETSTPRYRCTELR